MKKIIDRIVKTILTMLILVLCLAITVTLLPSDRSSSYQTVRAEYLPSVGEILEKQFEEMELERRLNQPVLIRLYDRACGYYDRHERYVTFKKWYPQFREGISDRHIDQRVVEALKETAEPFIQTMYPRLLSDGVPGCPDKDSEVIGNLIAAMDDAGKPYDRDLLVSLLSKAIAREAKSLASK